MIVTKILYKKVLITTLSTGLSETVARDRRPSPSIQIKQKKMDVVAACAPPVAAGVLARSRSASKPLVTSGAGWGDGAAQPL